MGSPGLEPHRQAVMVFYTPGLVFYTPGFGQCSHRGNRVSVSKKAITVFIKYFLRHTKLVFLIK